MITRLGRAFFGVRYDTASFTDDELLERCLIEGFDEVITAAGLSNPLAGTRPPAKKTAVRLAPGARKAAAAKTPIKRAATSTTKTATRAAKTTTKKSTSTTKKAT